MWAFSRPPDIPVPAAPVYSIADIVADPQYQARDMLLRLPATGGLGELLVPGVVPRFSDAPGGVRWLGRPVGHDTVSVLSELLGLGSDEIEGLADDGVIGLGGEYSAVPGSTPEME